MEFIFTALKKYDIDWDDTTFVGRVIVSAMLLLTVGVAIAFGWMITDLLMMLPPTAVLFVANIAIVLFCMASYERQREFCECAHGRIFCLNDHHIVYSHE